MPKRSRSGEVSRPARVVAPTRVNGRQVQLDGARRRALADHDVELVVLHRRVQHLLDHRGQAMDLVDEQHVARPAGWSAMRPGPRAARAPGRRSGAGSTPSSAAMMCARVVLPRPGGPKISTWSSASPRWRAALMKISSCSLTGPWPMYSFRRRGRMARSIASSSVLASPLMMRSSVTVLASTPVPRSAGRGGSVPRSSVYRDLRL